MSRSRATRLAALSAAMAIIAIVTAHRTAYSCITLTQAQLDAMIRREEAIIVWDESRHVEHFIRRVQFETNSPTLGFIVPTPTQPALVAEKSTVFDRLAQITMPPVKTIWVDSLPAIRSTTGMPKSAVTVIRWQTIGGYDAVVLSATDAVALHSWLKTNQFVAPDGFDDYVKPYIADHWYFTAFRLRAGQEKSAQLNAVRMTFHALHPFYPYREPPQSATKSTPYRELVLYVLSQSKVIGAFRNTEPGYSWAGQVTWANYVRGGNLAADLTGGQVKSSEAAYLTKFVDDSNPRPGIDDLTFSADTKGKSVTPPTEYEYRVRPKPFHRTDPFEPQMP